MEKKMSKTLYTLTDEHRAQLAPWASRWIANAMSTKPMDNEDRRITREAVKGLYLAAGLTPPPDHRIVFVSSPFVGRFASGFAAAIWYNREQASKGSDATRVATDAATRDATDDATRAATNAATRDATDDATSDATRAATDDATDAATYAATDAATRDATNDATRDATRAATDAATRDATRVATDAATRAATRAATDDATRDATDDATSVATDDATRVATYDATDAATDAATRDALVDRNSWYQVDIAGLIGVANKTGAGKLGLRCAQDSWKFWQGGNQWSAWVSYLSFFRHVAKLPIDYSKFDHYEKAATHSGPRWMHKEFCIISDRPEVLTVNERNQPHNVNGPFCKWRDGSALYSINGVRIPAWIAETPDAQFTKEMILSETNVDNRRCIIQKLGIENAIKLLGAETVDEHISSVGGKYELLSIDYDGRGNKRPYLKMSSKSINADHIEGVDPSVKTVKEAICYRNKLIKFIEPEFLS
jgi:hypothetical protein